MTDIKKTPEENEISLAELITNALRYKWWFLLSIVLCLSLGVLYLLTTPKIYSRTAVIMVKDGNSGGSSQMALFQEMLGSGSNSVQNEIGLLNSKRLMREVVQKLNLTVNYKHRKGLRTSELYNSTPIEANFENMLPDQGLQFKATIIDGDNIEISDIVYMAGGDKVKDKSKSVIAFGERLTTPIGDITINPTLFMNEEYEGESITVVRGGLNKTAIRYSNMVSIALVNKQATLIMVSFNDESIARTEDVINTLLQVYQDDAINDQNAILLNTIEFIDDRLAFLEKDLKVIDAEIENYKKENNLTDIISESALYLKSSERLDSEGLVIENQIHMVKFINDYLNDKSKIAELIPANIGIGDPGLQVQINEYNALLTRRNQILLNSSAKNPLVMDIQGTLASMRTAILKSIDNLISTLEIQLGNIEKKGEENTVRISSVPTQQKYIANIQRQLQIKEELFLFLLNKREESELQLSLTESNAKIVDNAEGQLEPVEPISKFVLFIALIMGLAIPSVVIYVISIFDTKIKSKRDIDKLTIPYIGSIPNIEIKQAKGEKRENNNIIVKEGNRGVANEAFRVVRTNLDFICDGNRSNQDGGLITQLISLVPGSGKSFISANLGVSIGLKGIKVLLIDADMRKKALSAFAQPRKVGMSDYLSGRADNLEELIIKDALVKGVDMLPVGAMPPNPSELLLKPIFTEMIKELKSKYDYIIIDCPPVDIVPDSAIIAPLCDTSIFVVRAGNLDKRLLPDVQSVYDHKKYNNLCLLLNGVKQSDSGLYGYQYHSYYGVDKDADTK